MHPFDNVLLVANPISGAGQTGRWLDRVAALLRERVGPVQTVATSGPGEAREAAERLAGRDALIVAFGGDGTLNEVLNGADLARVTLGIVPAGTGNVLAKELGMSLSPDRAVRQLLMGRVVRADSAVCNGRRFICVFGAGFDGRIVQLVHQDRGRWLTQFHYLPHIVRSIPDVLRYRVHAEADGQPVARGVSQLSIGNTASYGGPLGVTTGASPHDGLLDVMALSVREPLQLAEVLAGALLRALHMTGAVRYGRARRVTVWSTGVCVPYELDGEPAGELPATIEVLPDSVRLLVPRGYRRAPQRRISPYARAGAPATT